MANSLLGRYPLCTGLNIKSADFKKCTLKQDEVMDCIANIEKLLPRKILENKIYCEKQAYIQFPDIDDNSYSKEKELEYEEKKKEYNLTLQFLSGNTLELSNARKKRSEYLEKEVTERNKKAQERIYSKTEILELREQFFLKCNRSSNIKNIEFIEERKIYCQNIGLNWDN